MLVFYKKEDVNAYLLDMDAKAQEKLDEVSGKYLLVTQAEEAKANRESELQEAQNSLKFIHFWFFINNS